MSQSRPLPKYTSLMVSHSGRIKSKLLSMAWGTQQNQAPVCLSDFSSFSAVIFWEDIKLIPTFGAWGIFFSLHWLIFQHIFKCLVLFLALRICSVSVWVCSSRVLSANTLERYWSQRARGHRDLNLEVASKGSCERDDLLSPCLPPAPPPSPPILG